MAEKDLNVGALSKEEHLKKVYGIEERATCGFGRNMVPAKEMLPQLI